MAVVKERKFEEERKFLIEPLNMLAPLATVIEVNWEKKVYVIVIVPELPFRQTNKYSNEVENEVKKNDVKNGYWHLEY